MWSSRIRCSCVCVDRAGQALRFVLDIHYRCVGPLLLLGNALWLHRHGVSWLCARGGLIGSNQVNLEPPSGSRISVTTEGAHPLIVVPHGSGGLMRYFFGLFFLAFLGFWVVSFGGEVSRLPFGD